MALPGSTRAWCTGVLLLHLWGCSRVLGLDKDYHLLERTGGEGTTGGEGSTGGGGATSGITTTGGSTPLGCTAACCHDADCQSASGACKQATCEGGTCVAKHAPAGSACTQAVGPTGVCDGQGACVDCVANADCPGAALPVCCKGVCSAAAALIAAGTFHTCARRTDGTLWCWGKNDGGQLGNGTVNGPDCNGACIASPVQSAALGDDVADVVAGILHTCALDTGGALRCWGRNDDGQLGDGTNVDHASPALVNALGNAVVQPASGRAHACARLMDGSLSCWGQNKYGQLGDGTVTNRSTPAKVSALGTEVAEVVAGSSHTCVRKTDHTIWCWGRNNVGQLGQGTTSNHSPSPSEIVALGNQVVKLAAGDDHTCALKVDGSVHCWGSNGNGECGDGTTTDRSSPVQVAYLDLGVVDVAAGWDHTCARFYDGRLYCWGSNGEGELGDGTNIDRHLPVEILAVEYRVASVAAGNSHTCALMKDGTVWCWGRNDWSQLGSVGAPFSAAPVGVHFGACL